MRIVIGTDFSTESVDAARQGFAMARQLGASAEVIVAHVLGAGAWYPTIGTGSLLDSADTRYRTEKHIEEFLAEHLGEEAGVERNYRVVLGEGRARKKLADIARAEKADWLFVGRSGSGALVRWALGSTSHSLATHAPCNLAIAHERYPDWQAHPKLAVAVDFSPHGEQALALAIDLALKSQAALHLIHVIYPAGPVIMPERGLAYSGGEFTDIEVLQQRANAEMDSIGETWAPELEKIRWSTSIITGYPTREIVEYARANNIDGLFLGTVGRSAIDNFILGSVADGVLKHTPCTVYLTPPAQ